MAEEKHNLADSGGDTLEVVLTNTAPDVTQTVLDTGTNHPPPAAANGYSAQNAVISGSSQTSGTYKLTLADVTFTASGGQIGPFRYAILYNQSAPSDELIGYIDRGSSITLEDGQTYTVDFNASNGVFQGSFA